MKDRIAQKLSILNPVQIDIIDDSAKHAGHSGARAGGETHFSVRVVSEQFNGKNMVARHKMIYELLNIELKEQIHALALKTLTKEEAGV
jgi:BolA protein